MTANRARARGALALARHRPLHARVNCVFLGHEGLRDLGAHHPDPLLEPRVIPVILRHFASHIVGVRGDETHGLTLFPKGRRTTAELFGDLVRPSGI